MSPSPPSLTPTSAATSTRTFADLWADHPENACLVCDRTIYGKPAISTFLPDLTRPGWLIVAPLCPPCAAHGAPGPRDEDAARDVVAPGAAGPLRVTARRDDDGMILVSCGPFVIARLTGLALGERRAGWPPVCPQLGAAQCGRYRLCPGPGHHRDLARSRLLLPNLRRAPSYGAPLG